MRGNNSAHNSAASDENGADLSETYPLVTFMHTKSSNSKSAAENSGLDLPQVTGSVDVGEAKQLV